MLFTDLYNRRIRNWLHSPCEHFGWENATGVYIYNFYTTFIQLLIGFGNLNNSKCMKNVNNVLVKCENIIYLYLVATTDI